MATYQELISIVDRDTALSMMAKFGGRTVSLPSLKVQDVTLRILKLYRDGVGIPLIASSLQLEIKTIVDVVESCLTHKVK